MGTIVHFLLYCSFLVTVFAELDPKLTGTWSTKSWKVVTGPDFYDPVKDRLKEPENTGISYSFSEDGYFEEAYYRALANPSKPSCPRGLMQFQHGKYSVESNGSLVLSPFTSDGRQQLFNPCKSKKTEYTRYNQTEVFKRYEIITDPFHNVKRLNLYQHDGTPMHPMFLMYKPPQMLPTKTLNPTVMAKPTGSKKLKRGLSDDQVVLRATNRAILEAPDQVWWFGVAMTSIGGFMLAYPQLSRGRR